ncbi:response regulator [Deinococcus koreensis]|uniref:DNA-binding response regulator n=1 Tax=Deinococcus koreensis TaxID=2054903 RepID=A0A2K3UT88_9DEIO|nr:response regulator transcription factor [Deinococcus koreensis]PNY79720.1 DNA-binding response regulator [Deinococcus koreensis]
MTLRLLIVDDHPLVREGLTTMLGSQDDFTVVGAAVNGADALRQAALCHPDVVLMDLRMPGQDGVSATAELRRTLPGIRVLVLTTYDSDADILRAIEAGAVGYLLKDVPHQELFAAIRGVARGERRLASAVAERLMHRSVSPSLETLTPREQEVLELVGEGLSNKRVAAQLGVSDQTVKAHLLRVFDKLGVDSRTAAVLIAQKRGLLRRGS